MKISAQKLTVEHIRNVLEQHLADLEQLGVRRLGVFGSVTRGDTTPESDIDFLVEFQPGRKTYRNFIRLAYLLEDLLGRRVELVTPEGLSPHIGPHILKEVQYVIELPERIPVAHSG